MDITPRLVRILAHKKDCGAALSGTELLVWMWMVAHASRRGVCRHTYQHIADGLDITQRSVRRAEAVLCDEDLGSVVIREGQRVGFLVTDLSIQQVPMVSLVEARP